MFSAYIGGHDNHGILKINRPPLTIGQSAVFQYLQQHVKHIRVGFFDLIQQQHGIGFTPYFFRHLTAFFIAHIARRRSHQTGHRVFFHVFGHVQANHGVFIAKKRFRQSPSQLGFAHAGRPQENKRANRTLRVLQPRPGAAHGTSHSLYRLVLTDNSFMQNFFQLQQPLGLFFR